MNRDSLSDQIVVLKREESRQPEDIEIKRNLAEVLAESGRWQEAAETYIAATKIRPKDPSLQIALGRLYEGVDYKKTAEKSYKRAIAIQPSYPKSYLSLGLLYEKQERYSEARRCLEKCLEYSNVPDERAFIEGKLTSLPERQHGASSPGPAVSDEASPLDKTVLDYRRRTRNWGLFLSVIGLINLIGPFLVMDRIDLTTIEQGALIFALVYGLLLILVGLSYFYFRSVALLPVYAVIIVWDDLLDIMNGKVNFSTAIGFIMGAYMFYDYYRFRRIKAGTPLIINNQFNVHQPDSDRAANTFPWISLITGGPSLTMLAFFILVEALSIFSENELLYDVSLLLVNAALVFGILGLAFGVAGLLAGFPRKWASITGSVCGGLAIIALIILTLLG